jgi:poly(3-hydroxybutyrate) depolymerase
LLALLAASCGDAGADGAGAIQEDEVGLASAEDALVAAPAAPLPKLRVDLGQTTVSGLSSGAFMAVQMHVAHSGIVRGAAVFAGGPFLCAGGDVTAAVSTCMAPKGDAAAPDASLAVARLRTLAAAGLVDPPSELAKGRVFLFGGERDATVAPLVMDRTRAFYEELVPREAVAATLHVPGTGHVLPTLASGDPCDAPRETYLGRCGRDGAGEALSHLVGPLAPPATRPTGRLARFRQARFALPGAGLASEGFVYVPRSCARGEMCKVHVAFHGCKQHAEGPVGERFVREAGYLRWADTNRIVVLFPQTTTGILNPNACWDWWGYTGPTYATKLGLQVSAVRAMLDDLVAAESARR